jgi:hypothetical protein
MHAVYRVLDVRVVGPYTLAVDFDDSTRQEIDLEPVLQGELYGPLRQPELFAAVTVDPEVGTIVWPNGADFDPETLHDWAEHRTAFVAAAQRWAAALSA